MNGADICSASISLCAQVHQSHAQYLLLYLLAYYADKDMQRLMEKIRNEQVESNFYCVKALGLLMRLHYDYKLCDMHRENEKADMSIEFKAFVSAE